MAEPEEKQEEEEEEEEEIEKLQWAAIERLPTVKRMKSSLFNRRVVDVTELGAVERHLLIDNLIKNVEQDNRRLLQKIRERMDRMTLLLGPPGCGKTTLLSSLAGKVNQSLKVTEEITYNGSKLDEMNAAKASAYISQHDFHIPQMTVRETLDFSARCQGKGDRAGIMAEVLRREKQAGIVPDPMIDTYMKAIAVEGLQTSLQTDYMLKILGLENCSETMVGDAMRRGEMMIGPARAFFMDEISNGLDSSTTFQIISCIQQTVHIMGATVLISLLQPAPETFNLFDDIILMAEGKIIYHGPRELVLAFFEDCGFRCPQRKGIADFLQEIISEKDQTQYWHNKEMPYSFITVNDFSEKFKSSNIGKRLQEEISEKYDNHHSKANLLLTRLQIRDQ